MDEQLLYNKFMSTKSFELSTYIGSYLSIYPHIEILIGSDSQNYSETTVFANVVALYNPGKGAHIVYRKWKTPLKQSTNERLLTEVWEAVKVAEYMKKVGLPKPSWIDIDLNPDVRFKSNEVFRQAVGLVEGMGYRVRYKSQSPMMTYAADYLIKN